MPESTGKYIAVAVTVTIILLICLVLPVVLIVKSNNNSPDGPTDDRFGLADTPINSRVIADDKTGVYYLVLEHDGIAVTPLLSADGLPLMVDDLNHGDMQTALNAAKANEVEQ